MTTFADYEKNAMRTWSGSVPDRMILNAALGLCGEAGEVADIVKKATFQGHELNRDKIIEEMGDIMWYLALGCSALGVTMGDVAQRNVDKLRQRYPDGFSVEKSVHRAE